MKRAYELLRNLFRVAFSLWWPANVVQLCMVVVPCIHTLITNQEQVTQDMLLSIIVTCGTVLLNSLMWFEIIPTMFIFCFATFILYFAPTGSKVFDVVYSCEVSMQKKYEQCKQKGRVSNEQSDQSTEAS